VLIILNFEDRLLRLMLAKLQVAGLMR